MACRILVLPGPGIETIPPAVEMQSLNGWSLEVSRNIFKNSSSSEVVHHSRQVDHGYNEGVLSYVCNLPTLMWLTSFSGEVYTVMEYKGE